MISLFFSSRSAGRRVRCARLLLVALLALVLTPQRPAQATTITVTALTSGFTPTNNNYTILANALGAAGANDTIVLSGVFDWTEPNAAASWALGSDTVGGNGDDYSLLVPAATNAITLTAASLGAATIQGPGDLAAQNLEGFLVFDGGDNQGWTISNLRMLDFDLSIGMFSGAGGADAFNNTRIVNNYIRVATDLNATVAPADVNQNIGIHFSFGTNQTIQGNTIEIPGNGVSDSANNRLATDVGMQSNTSGGSVYDGLLIDNNTIRVLNAQSANPERIIGIWENSHGHTSDIAVSNNHFVNAAAGNNSALNMQTAFRVTSHSSSTTLVSYTSNTVAGANVGFGWLAGQNFAGNQPVRLWANTLTNNATGVLIQSDGLANLNGNRIEGSGSGSGVRVVSGQLAASGSAANAVQANFIRNGSGDGIRIEGGAGAIGTIYGNDLSGNALAIRINAGGSGAIAANCNRIQGNTTAGLRNDSTRFVDATLNWWGSASGPTHSSNPGGTGQLVQAAPAVVDLLPFAPGASPCVTVTKTASAPSVMVTKQLTYTLVVSNATSIAVPGLVLTDTLPAGATYASATPAPGSTNPLVWNVGALAASQALTYTVVVNVSGNATGSLVNTAQLGTPALAGPATAAVTTSVTTVADLALTLSDSPDPAATSASLAYTLRVTNAGPSIATSVIVTDTLAAGVVFVGASGAGWSCAHNSGVVICTRPSLGVGVAPDIVITVTPGSPGAIANGATVV
ncbi:MAG TPA: DUF11 domain-containing protein, partial [Roseiflexaceae bacterium]|nr:DUF11 domain-containing protein [Roseiflexaceae bacterium]